MNVLIVLSGLPGAGKTTIARELASSLAAVYLRIDSIEEALRQAGLAVEGEGYAVAHIVAADHLRAGQTVVADCVNPWPLTRDQWRAVALQPGVPVVEVGVVCSDEREHRRRVASRAADMAGAGVPTSQEVVERDYRPWGTHRRLVIDTAQQSVPDSVQAVLSALPVRH